MSIILILISNPESTIMILVSQVEKSLPSGLFEAIALMRAYGTHSWMMAPRCVSEQL